MSSSTRPRPFPHLSEILVVWVALASRSLAYNLEYTNCLRPTRIQRYEATSICASSEADTPDYHRYTLVQRRAVVSAKDYRCWIQESCFRFFCGAFSHFKLAKVPQIQHEVLVFAKWCRSLVTFHSPWVDQDVPHHH